VINPKAHLWLGSGLRSPNLTLIRDQPQGTSLILLQVGSFDDLSVNTTIAQLKLCAPLTKLCHTPEYVTSYVDTIISNQTTIVKLIRETVVNQTTRIKELTRWISECKCGCADQSTVLTSYLLTMNVLTTASALYWSISAHSDPRTTLLHTVRRDLISVLVLFLLFLGGFFSLADPCPNHWSEAPMLACAATVAVLMFLPYFIQLASAQDRTEAMLKIIGGKAVEHPAQESGGDESGMGRWGGQCGMNSWLEMENNTQTQTVPGLMPASQQAS